MTTLDLAKVTPFLTRTDILNRLHQPVDARAARGEGKGDGSAENTLTANQRSLLWFVLILRVISSRSRDLNLPRFFLLFSFAGRRAITLLLRPLPSSSTP